MEESGRVEQLKELSGRVFDVRFVFVRGLNLPVIDLDEQQVLGRIPMGWYPNSVSARCTTTRALPGSLTPGLAFIISGSFHFVIFPRKMPASDSRVKFSAAVTPGMLYVGTTAPNTVGKCSTL
jgi:hypothetical protein